MAIVFVSYWANYAKWQVCAVYNHLSSCFDRPIVFLDTTPINLADKLSSVIWEHLREARVLLGIVGPQWLTAQNLDGLDFKGPDDWGRRGIAEAIDNAALLRKETRACDLTVNLHSLIKAKCLEMMVSNV
jgi:hypothetical protein